MGNKLQQFWVTDVVEEHFPARLVASDITMATCVCAPDSSS